MSKTVVLIRCEAGKKILQVFPMSVYLDLLKDSKFDGPKRLLTEARGPMDLDTFEGDIIIEGALVVPKPHPELIR